MENQRDKWVAFIHREFGKRLTVGASEFSKRMGWAPMHLTRAIRAGELPALKLGSIRTKRGKFTVTVDALAEWLAAREVNAGIPDGDSDDVDAKSELMATAATA